MQDLCVVGLGNPGDKYHKTRHNAGYDFLDLIAKELKIEKAASTGSDVALPALGRLNSFLNINGISIRDAFLVNNKILLKNFLYSKI